MQSLKTLTDLCQYLRNWFDRGREKLEGHFQVTNGHIYGTGAHFRAGQYVRVIGSLFNDGVHIYPGSDMTDEVFDGQIWLMAVPPAVIDLCTEIEDWEAKYSEAMASPFQSENIQGVYSYTKTAAAAGGSDGKPVTWMTQFADSLDRWRKI